MDDPYRREKIGNWVGDFLESKAFREQSPMVREYAPEVLSAFLEAACAARSVGPEEVEEADLKPALLKGVAGIEIPASVRPLLPALCGAFLGEMQEQGRLAGGRTLGLYVRALKQPYLDAAGGSSKPIVSPGSKLGRNDPCPCGSGRKYKKCCMGGLG